MATSRPGKAVSPQAAAFDRNEVQEETSPPPALSPHPLSLPLTNGETRSPVTQPGDRRPPHAVLARGDALCTSRRAERLGLGGGGQVKAARGPPADSLALTRSGRLGVLVSWLAVGRRPRPAAEACSLREVSVAGGAGIPQAPEVWPQAHEGA